MCFKVTAQSMRLGNNLVSNLGLQNTKPASASEGGLQKLNSPRPGRSPEYLTGLMIDLHR